MDFKPSFISSLPRAVSLCGQKLRTRQTEIRLLSSETVSLLLSLLSSTANTCLNHCQTLGRLRRWGRRCLAIFGCGVFLALASQTSLTQWRSDQYIAVRTQRALTECGSCATRVAVFRCFSVHRIKERIMPCSKLVSWLVVALNPVNHKGLHQGCTQTSFCLKVVHFTSHDTASHVFLAYLYSAGTQHGNPHPAGWSILFGGPTQEPVLVAAITGITRRAHVIKRAGAEGGNVS